MKTFTIEVPVLLPVLDQTQKDQQTKMTAFEEYKHRKALALQTSIARKYVGPPDDPHFTPNSPIMSRQTFSLAEEAELHRSCAIVLSQIPHSDETNEEAVKDLINQVTSKEKRFSRIKQTEKLKKVEVPEKPRKDWKEWRREKRAAAAAAEAAAAATAESKEEEPCSQPRSILSEDSTTPSDLSKRETMMTCRSSPGTTPGDATCPLPESARPSTANPGSNLRTELKSFKEESSNRKVMSFLSEMGTIYTERVTPAARSMTYLPASDTDKPQSNLKTKSRSREKRDATPRRKKSNNTRKHTPAPKANVNKSLPHVPNTRTRADPTIRLVGVHTNNADRHFVPKRLQAANRINTEPEVRIAVRSQHVSTNPSQVLRTIASEPIQPYESHLSPSSKKKPFDFGSFFQRRKGMEGRETMVAIAAA